MTEKAKFDKLFKIANTGKFKRKQYPWASTLQWRLAFNELLKNGKHETILSETKMVCEYCGFNVNKNNFGNGYIITK